MKNYYNTEEVIWHDKSFIEIGFTNMFFEDRFKMYWPTYSFTSFICSNNLVDMDLEEIITLYKLQYGEKEIMLFPIHKDKQHPVIADKLCSSECG
jgi:hypothetical protein